MAWNAEYPTALSAPERRYFGREIFGILEALASILLLLALVSYRSRSPWIGTFGEVSVRALFFVLGRYVSYAVPGLLAMSAVSAIFGSTTNDSKYRIFLRAAGGLILLFAACGLITLHMSIRSHRDPAVMFDAGGLIGNFFIDQQGLNVPRHLGRLGSFLLFYGCVLIGFVLFTETMVRDAGRAMIRIIAFIFMPGRWGTVFGGVIRSIKAAFENSWFRVIGRFLQGIDFGSRRQERIMSETPIKDIRPFRLRGSELKTPADEDEQYEEEYYDDEEAEDVNAMREEFESECEAEACEDPNPPVFRLKKGAAKSASDALQPEFEFKRNFELPSFKLLADPPPAVFKMSQEDIDSLSHKIEQTLAQFKIDVQVIEVVQGPTVTRFALRIAPGIRVSKILALENDLALALKAQQVRILAPIPGQAAVGIEVPNKHTNPVFLRELLESDAFRKSKSPLCFALGKNIAGEPVIADLAQMPHVLIAGATGSGKSVCLNTIIASLLFRNGPDKVKMVMIDPKRVELAIYQAIPHLLAPVVCEPKKAAAALHWTVDQMESRYKLLAELGVRNIDGYNAIVNDKLPNKKAIGRNLKYMPHIVVIIDELADLMVVAKNEVEEFVIRLAQMARAVGIHLILATQRPSVNVITGIIKANFPSRIAFRVSSKVDSRTILDMNGAQALLGRGDMLYSPGGVKPFRIQGAFVSDEEIERLADYIRAQEKARYEKDDFEVAPTPAQRAKAQLMMSIAGGIAAAHPNQAAQAGDSEIMPEGDEFDSPMATAGRVMASPLPPADMETLGDEDLYDVALRLVLESRKASVSYIQRRLKIGYARAGRVMDMMEERGIVGPYQGSKPRDLIIDAQKALRELAEAKG